MGKLSFPGRGPVLNELVDRLHSEGYTKTFLKNVVPDWWSAEAEQDPGALAELKAILGKRIGLDIAVLLSSGATVPVTPLGIHFKRSTNEKDQLPPDPTLAFCGVVGRALAAISSPSATIPTTADEIREELLSSGRQYVSLDLLAQYCWARNIVAVHIAEMPTTRKGMEALTARFNARDVIILTRRSHSVAWAAFHLAHELGHIALRHVGDNEVLVDEENDLRGQVHTQKEKDADTFAADLLGGSNLRDFWSRYDETPKSMAAAVLARAPSHKVDPAHVILRYARRSGNYRLANAALKLLPLETSVSPAEIVNTVALKNIDLSAMSDEIGEVITTALGIS